MLFQSTSANHSKNGVLFRRHWILLFCLPIYAGMAVAATDVDAECVAKSGRIRAALVELYTSEGCNSCPPADRWLSGLPGPEIDPSQLVALAFHVDYWDYLGWRDRFAQPEFATRQRMASHRSGAKFMYTPQVLLNGVDTRSTWRSDIFGRHIREISQREAVAYLSLAAQFHDRALTIRLAANYSGSDPSDVFVALTQNNLESRVRAGENAGKTLRHDFVVRQLWGPLPVAKGSPVNTVLNATLPDDFRGADAAVSAFVQTRATGDVAQALTAAVCEK